MIIVGNDRGKSLVESRGRALVASHDHLNTAVHVAYGQHVEPGG